MCATLIGVVQTMPAFCAAYGCANRGGRDDVAFHAFPKDKKRAALWASLMQCADFKPNKHSLLCSEHFVDSNYHQSLSLMRALNKSIKSARLRPGAVPSVFPHKRKASLPPRRAFAKRRKQEGRAQTLRCIMGAREMWQGIT